MAAVYYSYYMLPDGTYCLAPPPPGVDVAAYYSTLPAGGATAAPPPPGTTPPPPPNTAETSSGVTATLTTRYAYFCPSAGTSFCSRAGVFGLALEQGLCRLRV